jgi:predicted DNA-binding protein
VARLTVLPDHTLDRLDALCVEQGLARAVLVRRLITAALEDPIPEPDVPSEDELLALLAEKIRQGNVAAIRSLL